MASPFIDRREWSWPAELRVSFVDDGARANVESDTPTKHPPDLRALTILEGREQGTLRERHPVERLTLALGQAWRATRGLDLLLLRVGLLRRRLRIDISVLLDGSPLTFADPFGGAADHLIVDELPPREVTGEGLELLAKALDHWITDVRDRLTSAADAVGGGDAIELPAPSLPSLRLAPPSPVHPRIAWIADRLRTSGIAIDVPPRPAPRAPEGFVARLTGACVAWKSAEGISGAGQHRGVECEHILPTGREEDGVWPSLVPGLVAMLPQRSRHSAFGNLKSSQCFAINVLGGLRDAGVLALAIERHFGHPPGTLEVERLRFEYAPVEMRNVLGEEGDHSTQIDAVVWLREGHRRRALVTEVKLTEGAFGGCRGPSALDNPGRHACESTDSAVRIADCYLRNGGRSRRYLLHDSAFAQLGAALGRSTSSVHGGCPLRTDGYQIARNLIVAAWLAGRLAPGAPKPPVGDAVDESEFVVLSARETPALHGPSLALLGPDPAARLASVGARWIDAAKLVALVADEPGALALVAWLARRYPPVFAP